MTPDNFEKLAIYHQLMHPFNEAMKFFERDAVPLAYIYPALKLLKHFMYDNPINTEMPGYPECRGAMIQFLREHRYKHLDLDLVKAAFWLTSFGAICLADPSRSVPEDHQLQLASCSPRRPEVDLRTIEQFAIPTCPVLQAEQSLDEEFEGKFTFQGDDIDEGSIDDASVLPRLERNVLQFL
jgi:hypothetical protein